MTSQSGDQQPAATRLPAPPQAKEKQIALNKITLSTGALKARGSIAQLTGSGGDSAEFDSWSENRK